MTMSQDLSDSSLDFEMGFAPESGKQTKAKQAMKYAMGGMAVCCLAVGVTVATDPSKFMGNYNAAHENMSNQFAQYYKKSGNANLDDAVAGKSYGDGKGYGSYSSGYSYSKPKVSASTSVTTSYSNSSASYSVSTYSTPGGRIAGAVVGGIVVLAAVTVAVLYGAGCVGTVAHAKGVQIRLFVNGIDGSTQHRGAWHEYVDVRATGTVREFRQIIRGEFRKCARIDAHLDPKAAEDCLGGEENPLTDPLEEFYIQSFVRNWGTLDPTNMYLYCDLDGQIVPLDDGNALLDNINGHAVQSDARCIIEVYESELPLTSGPAPTPEPARYTSPKTLARMEKEYLKELRRAQRDQEVEKWQRQRDAEWRIHWQPHTHVHTHVHTEFHEIHNPFVEEHHFTFILE